ncbi:unnamed protein product [Rotaria sordida]|uniref:Uncharacterized protein n=1 Tax=Rotaria sordida TaxID=392033 RepID=A0A814JJT2_9BILA|nr:unnamed protein product [Rotaria sordida]CAF1183753.1 unnamed protein product [Rotaria sordida]
MATIIPSQVDISNEESLRLVLNFLKAHLPESLQLWQLLDYVQRGFITKEHIWPHKLFVDNQDQIQCVVLVYSVIGFTSDHRLLDENKETSKKYVLFYSHLDNDHLLMTLLEQCVPWNQVDIIMYSDNDYRFSTMIKNLVREKKLGDLNVYSASQMEINRETLEMTEAKIIQHIPPDITIRRLSVADASFVNDHWEYKSMFSLDLIQYEIEHLPAFGAYHNEQLVSWCLTKFDGSFGIMFTLPEFRRLVDVGLLQIHKALDYIGSLAKPLIISKIRLDIISGQGTRTYFKEFNQVQTSSEDVDPLFGAVYSEEVDQASNML